MKHVNHYTGYFLLVDYCNTENPLAKGNENCQPPWGTWAIYENSAKAAKTN